MPTDYSKKKNAELEELLKSRSLPHTGKKADLVARLQQYDAQHSTEKATAATDAGGEDEIDWDEDAAPADPPTVGTDPAAAAAMAAGGQGQVSNPTAVPNQVVDIDPSTTKDLTVEPPAPTSTTDTEKKNASTNGPAKADEAPAAQPSTDFTSGLSSTSLDEEIAKRQKRAARFNIKEGSDDALKALERAKKFGTGTAEDKTAIRGLDEALPERVKKERGVKRGREETKEVRGDNKRRESGKRNNTRQNPRSRSRPKQTNDDKERQLQDQKAAEARKARFASGK